MSFVSDVKREICRMDPGKLSGHCRLAELAGIANYLGAFSEDGSYYLEMEQEQMALYVCKLISSVCNISKMPQISQEKRRKLRIYFRTPQEIKQILTILKVENRTNLSYHKKSTACEVGLDRPCCKKAFIRGSFLACGTMSEPDRRYRMEFVCDDLGLAEELVEQLHAYELEPRILKRKDSHVVYIKEGSQISDVFRIMGTHSAILEFENVRITRDVRGRVNRKVNCETANINRTITAAQDQIRDIELIRDRIGLENLPVELADAARARLLHDDIPLKELGMMMNPPVGKSGIKHRFDKLKAIADGLQGV